MSDAGGESGSGALGWRGRARLALNRAVRNPLFEARIDQMERSLEVIKSLAEKATALAARRSVEQFADEMGLLSARLESLQVRVDVMSASIAALRAEAADLAPARVRARDEQRDATMASAVRALNNDMDAKISNLLSIMTDAQQAGLDLKKQHAEALIEMINRLQLQMVVDRNRAEMEVKALKEQVDELARRISAPAEGV